MLKLSSIPISARYMTLSAFAFSIMALFVKALGESAIPVLEIVAARSVVSLVISYYSLRKAGVAPLGNRKGLLLTRGLFGFIGLNCVFYGVTHLLLAEAIVLQYLYPMFIAVLGLLILNECPTRGTLACIGLSFIGLLVILQPSVEISSVASLNIDRWIAVAGAFMSALAYITVRKLNKTEHHLVIVMYFPLVALPVSLLFLWGSFVMPEGIEWFYLLAVGLSTQVGQVALTQAMKSETASKASSFSYLQVVFTIILGIVFYQEIPSVSTLLGATFIIAGAYISVVWKSKAAGP